MSGWNIIAALAVLGMVFSGYSLFTAAYGTTMAFVLLVSFFLLVVSITKKNAPRTYGARSQQLAAAKRSVGSVRPSKGIHLIGPEHRDDVTIADIASITRARKKAVKTAKARKTVKPKKRAVKRKKRR